MSGNQAIAALGAYPYLNATDYQYLSALSTPSYSPSFRGTSGATQTTTQPAVQYVQAQPEKKNNTAKVILGTVAVIGAGLCIAAYRKGGDGALFERIGKGFKQMFGKTAAAATEKAAETAAEAATAGKKTIQEVGGKTVVTLPEEKNIISTIANKKHPNRSAATAVTELGKIGEKVDIGSISSRFEEVTKDGVTTWKAKDGNEIRSFVMEHTISRGKPGAGTYKIIGVKDGAITIVKDGKKLICDVDLKDSVYKQLEEQAKDVFAGKVDPSTLKQVIMRHTNKEIGLVATIKATTGNEELLSAVTNRFSADSSKIKYLRSEKDSALNEALKSFADPKKRGSDLNILRADVVLPADRSVTYTVDGAGNVIKVKFKDKGKDVVLDAIKDEVEFGAYKYDHQKAFDAVAKSNKKTWTNRIFEL